MIEPLVIVAGALLIALCVVAGAVLKAWQGWLEFKQLELGHARRPMLDEGSGVGSARIEMADLKERIRKLEAIASGVEL